KMIMPAVSGAPTVTVPAVPSKLAAAPAPPPAALYVRLYKPPELVLQLVLVSFQVPVPVQNGSIKPLTITCPAGALAPVAVASIMGAAVAAEVTVMGAETAAGMALMPPLAALGAPLPDTASASTIGAALLLEVTTIGLAPVRAGDAGDESTSVV